MLPKYFFFKARVYGTLVQNFRNSSRNFQEVLHWQQCSLCGVNRPASICICHCHFLSAVVLSVEGRMGMIMRSVSLWNSCVAYYPLEEVNIFKIRHFILDMLSKIFRIISHSDQSNPWSHLPCQISSFQWETRLWSDEELCACTAHTRIRTPGRPAICEHGQTPRGPHVP